jgi:rod shape determining protein RodA
MCCGAVFSVDYAYNKILQPHQRERIEVLLGKKSDPKGAGYNVNQSLIAIGSGGFFGKGYLQGTQTKYDFVPEQSTDFIFCTVGEEWGFIGSSFVIIILVSLMLRIILIKIYPLFFLISIQLSSNFADFLLLLKHLFYVFEYLQFFDY